MFNGCIPVWVMNNPYNIFGVRIKRFYVKWEEKVSEKKKLFDI
jgi:hypothetical protein